MHCTSPSSVTVKLPKERFTELAPLEGSFLAKKVQIHRESDNNLKI